VEQKKHLYNSRLGKVRWFVHRFGAREVFLKPLRMALAPLIIPTLGQKTFRFRGETLPYLLHRYNMTWASERCVEVPIARSSAQKHSPERTLEIGNVLAHYGAVSHDILDKFEKGPGVINQDVLSFRPKKLYSLIISVSTFEHIGYDDEAIGSSAEKIKAAIKTCLQWLDPTGELIITVPIGYNPELDLLLRENKLGAADEWYLRKHGRLDWRECSKNEALACRYKEPFPYANAVAVARFQRVEAA
jgi:hypothetical protein